MKSVFTIVERRLADLVSILEFMYVFAQFNSCPANKLVKYIALDGMDVYVRVA